MIRSICRFFVDSSLTVIGRSIFYRHGAQLDFSDGESGENDSIQWARKGVFEEKALEAPSVEYCFL